MSSLANAQDILIAYPNNFDADAVAASITLGRVAEKLNKPFKITGNAPFIPDIIKNLPLWDTICLQPSSLIEPQNLTNSHDILITINAPTISSLETFFKTKPGIIYRTPLVNINHGNGNEKFGTLNIIQETASSVSEIIYDILKASDEIFMDENIATCLLAGMVYKTKRFKSTSIAGQTLSTLKQLVANGAQKNDVFKHLYRTKTINALKLWSKILLNLKMNNAETVGWVTVQQKDIEETESCHGEFINITNELLYLIPTLQFIIFYYQENNVPTALVINHSQHNLLYALKTFNPNGSKDIVKISLPSMPMLLATLDQIAAAPML
ncbi:hypothetical protein HZC21_03655 [Candidatus Peregrinibacteria bacterium]|nr:hypothetical protein [Candidatus Peregrinibacteria bacterium]